MNRNKKRIVYNKRINWGGTWVFLGETLRFTGGFKNEDKEFSGIWEQSPDGRKWTYFMDIKLTNTN